jgi:hypothetical protein
MPVRREGEGASAGDPGWELVAAGLGKRPSPPSRQLRLLRVRGAGGGDSARGLGRPSGSGRLSATFSACGASDIGGCTASYIGGCTET